MHVTSRQNSKSLNSLKRCSTTNVENKKVLEQLDVNYRDIKNRKPNVLRMSYCHMYQFIYFICPESQRRIHRFRMLHKAVLTFIHYLFFYGRKN